MMQTFQQSRTQQFERCASYEPKKRSIQMKAKDRIDYLRKQAAEIESSKQRMSDKTGMSRNHPKFERVWAMAWDSGHACGIAEVEMHFEDLADLVMS